ncbi:MAG: hypothetical protein JAZ15_11780 [Candidatus Thiodiazotropha endolucinida]|nr:hypothetical protein [Candidatus Thiodiazotropha taylori]MCW4313701.1 hypothetical protein [Candidatus Thiodiazotropha taylori]
MTIVAAILLFLLFSTLSYFLARRIPSWIFSKLELVLIVLAFIGVLTALAQLSSESKKTEALSLINQAERDFGKILYSIEHRMDKCGVWWDIALDQTNKNPKECQKSDSCSTACRMGHLVSQYRWRPIDSRVGDWERLKSVVCATASIEHHGVTISEPKDELCKPITFFLKSLVEAQEAKMRSESEVFSNNWLLVIVQLLAGVALGLEVGKFRFENLKT